MSRKLKESLLYDYHHNLFVVKTMLPSVRNVADRQNVAKWLRFLKNNAKTIDEMKLRNDFMYYLVLGIQQDSLKPPFDKSPPNMPLMSMATLLPGSGEETEDQEFWSANSRDTLIGNADSSRMRKPEIIRRSPDGGEFLATQPIPAVGAFCYLAVVTKNRN